MLLLREVPAPVPDETDSGECLSTQPLAVLEVPMNFDPSIALGSIIHLFVLVVFLTVVAIRASRRLDRIEAKQDKVLDNLKPK